MNISGQDGTGSPVGQTHRYSQHQGSLDLFGESPLENGVDGDNRGPVAPISEDWPAPELIGADIEAPKPYPIQALGELQDVVIAVQDMTGTSTATAAAMSLSAISFLAQMDYITRTLGNDAPLSLFLLVLVGSGARKSSTYDLSYGAHVQSDDDLAVRYDAALEAWDNYKEGRDSGENGSASAPHGASTCAANQRQLGRGTAIPEVRASLLMPRQSRRGILDDQLVFEGNSSFGDVSDSGASLGRHSVHSWESRQTRIHLPSARPQALNRLDGPAGFRRVAV